MSTEFSFGDLFTGAMNWMGENPGLTMAGIGALGTLADPARPQTVSAQQEVRLPEYISPYVQRMLGQAESLSQEGHIPYSGARLADFNADQQAAFQRFRDLDPNNPMITQGGGIVGQAANQLLNLGATPIDTNNPLMQQGAGMMAEANQGLMGLGNRSWDQNAANQYMSPYQQGVTDIAKREALRDYETRMPGMNAAAQAAGAFGGSRHGVVQAEAMRNNSQLLNDIQTRGLQDAYVNAQGMFDRDLSRQGTAFTQAGQMGQGVAGIGQNQVANALQNRQIQGTMLGQAGQAGNTLAGIGQQGFQNQLAANQGLLGIGNQQQALDQQSANIGYQQFQEQRQHPYQQLGFMQQFLNGLPMTQTSTATTTPAPTLMQQLISAGIGGYNMGNNMGQP